MFAAAPLAFLLLASSVAYASPVVERQATNVTIDSGLFNEFVRYTKYSRAAYEPACAKPLGNTNVLQFESPIISTEGYIARDDSRKEYVIAFRGSEEPQDFLVDFTFPLVAFTSPGVTAPGTKVHVGFLSAYNAVAPTIIAALKTDIASHNDYALVCTGHSLGAALASICSVSIHQNFPNQSLRLFTFGQPRTGDKPYADFVDKTIGVDNLFRAVHTFDGVPTFVPRQLGFEHHSLEYFNFVDPATPQTVKKCQGHEDPTCSDAIPSTFINQAHTLYFNMPIGTFLLGDPSACQ